MRKVVLVLSFILWATAIQAQNVTVSYVQEGAVVHAFATSGGMAYWDHYLSPTEFTMLNQDIVNLNQQIVVQAKAANAASVPVTPPVPIPLTVTAPINPTTAATQAANYVTQQANLAAALATLTQRVRLLPVQTQITLINAFRTQVENAITDLPAPITH